MKNPQDMDLAELTSIRAFAAFVVVLLHMYLDENAMASSFWARVIADGHLGVDLFFILSGFILTHVYLPQWQAGTFRFGKFLSNRISRIYPLHLVMLLVFVLAYQGLRLTGLGSDFVGEDWAAFPAHLGLLHAWGTVDHHAWNFPSWSVSAEFFAYLIFPLMLWALLRLGAWSALGVGLVLFGLAGEILARQGVLITKMMFDFGIVRIFFEFAIGVALYRVFLVWRVPAAMTRPLLLALIVAVIGLAGVQADERLIVICLAAVIFVVGCLSMEERGSIMRHRALVYLGEISYATYMVHIFVLFVMNKIAEILGLTTGAGALVIDLVILVLIYGGSALLYHLVERPCRALLRRGFARIWR